MYIMSKDTYECDFCGFEIPWDKKDAVHGDMWGCEVCGKDFCEKCFTDRFGRKAWNNMFDGKVGYESTDFVLCPECYSKAISSQINKLEEINES